MKNLLFNKWLHVFILWSFLLAASFTIFSNTDFQKKIQYFVFDEYNKIHPRMADDRVVIVDLDENSLRKIGQWPWSRDIVADLVLKLDEMGAKVIAFDMVFAEEDRTSPRKIINNLPDTDEFIDIKNTIMTLKDYDQYFADVIKKTGKVVTGFTSAYANETRRLPYTVTNSVNVQVYKPKLTNNDKRSVDIKATRDIKNKLARNDVLEARGFATNLPIFSESAAGNGHFMVVSDRDGIIREVSLLANYSPVQFNSKRSILFPSLSLEAIRVFIGSKEGVFITPKEKQTKLDFDYEIKLNENYKIPINIDSKLWVHYRNIDKSEYIPAHSVLDYKNKPELKSRIDGKIVFIGTSAEGLRDIRSTPLKTFVPGVEVHVNVVEQILQNNFLVRNDFIIKSEVTVLLILGAIIIFLSLWLNTVWLGLFLIINIALMLLSSFYSYVHYGLLLDPFFPSTVLFLLYVGSSMLGYLRSELDRRQIKTAFGHYISPIFMEELTKDPDKLKLGGEVRELSVMFTDIRGFTKISERLSPEKLIQLMNDFLTPMSNLVMESRGTIDKYMGDAMMAFWNAPLDDPDHAHQACMTALNMNKALEPINEKIKLESKKEGVEPLLLSAGIGINTGPCSVGNMGSKQRFAYSALGDTVNLASRLEGQTKTYGVDTLLGEDTYKRVKNFALLELDLIKVIGREEPVRIYTLIGDQGLANTKEFKKWQAAHNGMLAAYRIADFSCAAQDCKEAFELSDGKLNKYYDIYRKRIIAFTKSPPPEGWDGVYVAKSK